MKRIRVFLVLSLLTRVSCLIVSAQQFAIKTNLLFDAAMTPDLGLELVTGEHSSVALSVFGHWHPYGLDSKMITIQPEYRFWFNGRPLVREYIGATCFVSVYDMTFNGKMYSGMAGLLGVTGGYVFPLGKRTNLELSGGFGVLLFRQRQYFAQAEGSSLSEEYNSYGYKLFPAKLAVTFIWILK